MSRSLLALLLLGLPASAAAAPYTLLNQGFLLDDATGEGLDGVQVLTFSLYDDADATNAALWTESLSVDFVDGAYSVVLGASVDSEITEELLDQNPLFLGLQVGTNAEMLPRPELHSVPYAILSETAFNLKGGSVDASAISVGGKEVVDSDGEWVGTPPSLGDAECDEGELLKWNDTDGTWDCSADDAGTDTLADLTCTEGQIPAWDDTDKLWACAEDAAGSGADGDTLADLGSTCADGEIPAWNDTDESWGCAPDNAGTDTLAAISGCAEDDILSWDGSEWTCIDAPADTLATVSGCSADDVLSWDGSEWTCIDAPADTLATVSGCSADDVLSWDGSEWDCIAEPFANFGDTRCNNIDDVPVWDGTKWTCREAPGAGGGGTVGWTDVTGKPFTDEAGLLGLLNDDYLALSGGTISGGLTAPTFTGDGSGLTNVTAATAGYAYSAGDAYSAYNATYANYANSTNSANYAYSAYSANSATNATMLNGLSGHALGFFNVALGEDALISGTGDENTAIGRNALRDSTSGSKNSALGHGALAETLDGHSNVAVGNDAMVRNSSGFNNVAVGVESAYSLTTGYSNVAVGTDSARATTTGRHNTAIGFRALSSNTEGSYSTAIGGYALIDATGGGDNTAIGWGALKGATTAARNIAVGTYAGNFPAGGFTGTDNVFIGYGLQPSNPTQSSTIRIGTNQVDTRIAGIRDAQPAAGATIVRVDSDGRLGSGCPAGMAGLGAWCIGDVQPPTCLTNAVIGCSNQGYEVCPLEALLICGTQSDLGAGTGCRNQAATQWVWAGGYPDLLDDKPLLTCNLEAEEAPATVNGQLFARKGNNVDYEADLDLVSASYGYHCCTNRL